MKWRSCFAAVIFAASCCFQTFSQTISIVVNSPAPASLQADALHVTVSVQSTYEIATILASVENRGTNLVYAPGVLRWTNVVSLEGLARGTNILTITASDVFGNSSQTNVTFRLDRPPRLTVSEPLDQSVARPNLQVRAYSEDDGPNGCQIYVFIGQPVFGNIPLRGTNAVSGSIVCTSTVLWIRATDSAGQDAWVQRTIVLENSTNITEVFDAPGMILDVTADAVLYQTTEDGQTSVKFRSRITEDEVVHPPISNHFLNTQNSVITGPNSALLCYTRFVWYSNMLFELNGTVVRPLSGNVGSVSYSAGRVAFDSGGILHFREFGSQSDLYSTPGTGAKLAENGTFLFAGGAGTALFQSRPLNPSQQASRTNVMLLPSGVLGFDGDGTNVVYHWLQTQTNNQLVILTPAGEDAVTSSEPLAPFLVNAGWVAYTKVGGSGQRHVWSRSPGGVHQQRTFFSTSSVLESLNSNGELTFLDSAPQPGNRYLSVPGVLQPIRISSGAGRVKWINGDLHIMLGRSLFRPVYGNVALARANPSEWRLRFQGIPGLRLQLQVSSNLLDWANLTSFTNATGTYDYLDPDIAPRRFYRAVLDTQ